MFSKIWEWLKRWWQFVAIGAALLVGILLGRRKQPPVVTVDPVKNDAEKKAVEDAKKAEEIHAHEAVVAKQEHDQQLEDVITKAEKNVEKKDDPQELNEFLKGVGKEMREP